MPPSDPAPPARRGRRLSILAGLLVLLAGGAGGGAYLYLGSGAPRAAAVADAAPAPGDGTAVAADGPPPEDRALPDPSGPVAVLELDEIVVDVVGRTTSGAPVHRFLKADYALVYAGTEAAERRLQERRVHLRDAFVDYTRLLREHDMAGSSGLAGIRSDLLLRAREVLGRDVPVEILISDLVLQ